MCETAGECGWTMCVEMASMWCGSPGPISWHLRLARTRKLIDFHWPANFLKLLSPRTVVFFSVCWFVSANAGSRSFWVFKIQDYFIISSEKLKHGWTLTTSQYTIKHILYFKTQRTLKEYSKSMLCSVLVECPAKASDNPCYHVLSNMPQILKRNGARDHKTSSTVTKIQTHY